MNKKLLFLSLPFGALILTLAWLLINQDEKLPSFEVDAAKPQMEAVGQRIQVLNSGIIVISETLKAIFPQNNQSKGFKRRFQLGILGADLAVKQLIFPEALTYYLDGSDAPQIATGVIAQGGFMDYPIKQPQDEAFSPGAHTVSFSTEISNGVYSNEKNQSCFGISTLYAPGNGVSKLEVTLKAEASYAVNAYILEAGDLNHVVATRVVNGKSEVLLGNNRDTRRVQRALKSDSVVFTASYLYPGERFMIEGCTQN